MTPQEMVAEFHRVFDCTVDDRSSDTLGHRLDLIQEEFLEVEEEILTAMRDDADGYPRLIGYSYIAKELADLVYMVYGTAVALGIDLDKAMEIVHESNMSKLWDDGKPRVRADGKILKPPDYQKPDLSSTVKELE